MRGEQSRGSNLYKNPRLACYCVILRLDPRISVLGNSKFLCDEIMGSSRGITQGRSG
ncbi:MAG: hypothetical protein MR878_01505 [Campylobacter sp.]|nr:hypothetical protein [Campylobacter sp.]